MHLNCFIQGQEGSHPDAPSAQTVLLGFREVRLLKAQLRDRQYQIVWSRGLVVENKLVMNNSLYCNIIVFKVRLGTNNDLPSSVMDGIFPCRLMI
jgi:hypothetical protein